MSRHVSRAPAWLIGAAAVCAIAAAVPSMGQDAPAEAVAAAVDPEAIRAVDRMAAHLRTLKTFQINVNSTIETVLENGQKVQFAGTTAYRVKPPMGLFADVRTDRAHRLFYYNGKSFTMYAPRMRSYTSVAAPGTIRETLDMVYDRYGIPLPLADLFYWGSSAEDKHSPSSAIVVGYARLGDVAADHYVFRENGFDYQLWIQRGDKPLPLKMVITDVLDPERPQYTATMRWTVVPAIEEATFNFKPPAGVARIEAVEVSN